MTKQQALNFLMQSWDEHDQEAKGYTEALCITAGRYIVRDQQGTTRAITNRSDYARSVRLSFNGNVYDRQNWRGNPVLLHALTLDHAA